MSKPKWVPLESNPEVLSAYSKNLGANKGEWLDVFALDDESLTAIPQPVVAVMLLFPVTDDYFVNCKAEDEKLQEKGQKASENVFYMKQVVSNACGTYGLYHALTNTTKEIELGDGILKEFLEETKGLSPEEKGEALAKNEKIKDLHHKIAEEGQTAVPNAEEALEPHFVALVHVDGSLYELDGNRGGPVNHGPTSPKDLLKDAAKVCRERIEKNPHEYRFTVMALTTAL